MKHMERLKDMLCDELDKIAEKGAMSAGDLDMVEKLTHSIKSISTIEAMDGYSQEDRYMGGNSYARDRMGRYSRDDRMNGSYSRDSHEMVEHLRDMMAEAPDTRTKNAIREAIRSIEA